jgi:large subunit ribosomal protein L29
MANIVELRGMENDELNKMLETSRREVFNLRFSRASGQLEDYTRIKVARREIAQIETALHMRQLAVEAAAAKPEIAKAISEVEDWDGNARFDYESSQWQVNFVNAKGKRFASATVDLNKKQIKSKKKAAKYGQVELVTSYEVTG